MTIKECIDNVDNIKPNQYGTDIKVQWLSFIDEIIINDVLKTHEGYDGRYDDFTGYSKDKLSTPLIVPTPYDRLYPAYLKMKIDGENGETARYNNSAALFNTYMMEFRKYYNKTHLPLSTPYEVSNTPKSNNLSVTDAQLEYLKRELYHILSNDVGKALSDDKIYSMVTTFMSNNAAMLKGKDGRDGVDGTVTFEDLTNEQKASLKGDKGDAYTLTETDKMQIVELIKDIILQVNKISSVTLPSDKWQGTASPYSQVVEILGATANSKIDLNPTIEQLNIFHEKDIAFVVANSGGVITVYCIGQKPANDYTMQVSITEVTRYE